MENYIIVAIVLLIVGTAVAYLIRAKKRGIKCVGCPAASLCAEKSAQEPNGCSCGCNNTDAPVHQCSGCKGCSHK